MSLLGVSISGYAEQSWYSNLFGELGVGLQNRLESSKLKEPTRKETRFNWPIIFIKALENALKEITAVISLLERKISRTDHQSCLRRLMSFLSLHRSYICASRGAARESCPACWVRTRLRSQTGGWFAFVAAHTIVL